MSEDLARFMINLDDSLWNRNIGGWRVEALLIPGSKVTAVYANGAEVDRVQYNFSDQYLRWSGSTRPPSATAQIGVPKNLHLHDEFEQQKLKFDQTLKEQEQQATQKLEEQKMALERRKAVFTFVIALASTILSAGVTTALVSPAGKQESLKEASAQPHADQARDCRDKLRRLSSLAKQQGQTVQTLSSSIEREVDPCVELLDTLAQ